MRRDVDVDHQEYQAPQNPRLRKKRRLPNRPELTLAQILQWADVHRRATGDWPKAGTGQVMDSGRETWCGINSALKTGRRGLPGGTSLTRLLSEFRGANPRACPDEWKRVARRRLRRHSPRPRLSIPEILEWADEYHRITGGWPRAKLPPKGLPIGESWMAINSALDQGHRGLPGGDSLANLLQERRGVRNKGGLPRLSIPEILEWADKYHRITGGWPRANLPPKGLPLGESWNAINQALYQGHRGLSGGDSLVSLLQEHRDDRIKGGHPPLSIPEILAWADEYHRITGGWPRAKLPPKGLPLGESWTAVNRALGEGLRGLPGGDTLARLLQKHRGVRNKQGLPAITIAQILTWADQFYDATGMWPRRQSGAIPQSPAIGETWSSVAAALARGLRGLPTGYSLGDLLAEHRGVRGTLSFERILAWADAHRREHGRWPTRESGPIAGAYDESWVRVDIALLEGGRGLPGGWTLPRLLATYRGRKPGGSRTSFGRPLGNNRPTPSRPP
jgi:hypothetical protein